MIKEYIFKTIISFISINAVIYLTKDNWLKLNPKKNGFIKRIFNRLVPCLIPIFRWIWIGLILIFGIALGNEDLANKLREENKNNEKDNSN